jgi:hypothetical protein|tara:strand:+ start:1618 stop:1893 length:276 start_codon:yes stop_codon:yes gene_type:complete
MKTAVKSWLLNLLLVSTTAAAILFAFIASWVILSRAAEIIKGMSGNMDTVMWGCIITGALLFWLNSLLLDSVFWITNNYWNAIKQQGDNNE